MISTLTLPKLESFRSVLRLLSFGFFFTLSCPLAAELPGRYKVHSWQVQHGLPQNNVTAVTQSKDGFLWFSMPDAIARFDGQHFDVFEASKISKLSACHFRTIVADHDGAIWIGTEEGTIVRLKNGVFSRFEPPDSVSKSPTTALVTDSQNTLWILEEDGSINRLVNDHFTGPPSDWYQPNLAPYKLFRTRQGQIWASNRNHLFELQNNTALLALEGTFGQYQFIAPGRNGGWWIAMGGKVRLWKDEQWIAELAAPAWERQSVTCAIEDKQGRLWIGTSGQGVFRYDPNGDMERFTTSNGLTSDLIHSITEDHEGNIWLATNGGGINRIHKVWFQSYGPAQGLSSASVSAITEGPAGEVWIGTEDAGLNLIKDGLFTKFTDPQGLASAQIKSLLSDSRGTLWVGTTLGKLFKKQGERFVPVPGILPSNGAIQSLFEDNNRDLWIGQAWANSLARLSSELLSPVPIPKATLPLHITAITRDRNRDLWFGTQSDGVFHSTVPMPVDASDWTPINGLPSESIRTFVHQTDGALWIGTAGAGLVRLHEGRVSICSRRDGLPDSTIHHIQDDGLGYLWCNSNQGIFRIEQKALNDFANGLRKNIHCLSFGIQDGLPTLKGKGGMQPAGCRTRDGKLWFLTQKGAVSIDPSLPKTAALPPPVYLNELRVDGEIVKPSVPSSFKTPPIEIPPGQHHLEFRYTGIHFRAPESIRFRYRMEGLDPDWIDAGAQRTAHYATLPAGQYRFHVIAGTPDGAWNETGATLDLDIKSHVWEQPWFIITMSCAAAALLATAVRALTRRRWRRRLRELELQQKVEAERNRIAQDIHDDLGAGLTQIGWLGEMSTRLAENPEQVRQQCRKIVATAHEMVASLDEIVWAVRPQNDSLKGLLEYLGGRVDEIFENSPIRLWYSGPHDVPDLLVLADTRHHFFLICKEVLNNTLKHSAATEVRMEVLFSAPDTLKVTIEDDGCGFDLNEAATAGNGLGNMQQRAERIGGILSVQTKPGAGCRTELTISLAATQALP
ncbi:MAG: two-component regulator propeller domain-containing protein [Verrucomicrobiota bacterium]